MMKATFFSTTKDADVHLRVVPHLNMGKVWTDHEVLFVGSGTKASEFFHALHAKEESFFAIMRAKVRAIGTLKNILPKH